MAISLNKSQMTSPILGLPSAIGHPSLMTMAESGCNPNEQFIRPDSSTSSQNPRVEIKGALTDEIRETEVNPMVVAPHQQEDGGCFENGCRVQ